MSAIVVNGRPMPIPAGGRVVDLVNALGHAGKRIAVELNGDIVPRGRHHEIALNAGDRIEIVIAVGGG
ncbi:sulfur carrier protein ThiS [Aromatoleum evansii]|uniref:Sulfur carrier protein ThiS n=1 Tax=Aromatoleum evansii TaxID=59406 RepID=A0ABZ1ANM2_AROEV|nr:sulfur carrier protein ThiS [Aromatoleum evansii]NMG29159.1 sulfur carrier protein ThiS [Aromatoleum evansii]WRL45718.1 sulfur carrier protein ThiS [Aromatoleum evansii]